VSPKYTLDNRMTKKLMWMTLIGARDDARLRPILYNRSDEMISVLLTTALQKVEYLYYQTRSKIGRVRDGSRDDDASKKLC
jgi:hypothetical protein